MNIVAECRRFEDELIELRRKLHRVPEIGGALPRTRKIVCEYLDGIGVPYTLNPAFDVDEAVLWKGVLAYVATAMKFLK